MTAPRFLITGGTRVDAGKTTFSAGFLSYLGQGSVDPLGVKPRAGNDLWYDHDAVQRAFSNGILYGNDAERLAAAGGTGFELMPDTEQKNTTESTRDSTRDGTDSTHESQRNPHPTDINPVHRLWRPTPGATGLLGEQDRTFIIDRVATAEGPHYVVNSSAERDGYIPDDAYEALPLEEATRVRSVEDLNEVTAELYLDTFDRLSTRLDALDRPLVIESYADIAVPLETPVDAVAVVEPTRVRLYQGPRFLKTRERVAGSPRQGSFESHTDAVTDGLDPDAVRGLDPLPETQRNDISAVANNYATVYDSLLDLI